MIDSEIKFSDDSAQKDSRKGGCWAPKSSSEFWLTTIWIVVIPLAGIITGMVSFILITWITHHTMESSNIYLNVYVFPSGLSWIRYSE